MVTTIQEMSTEEILSAGDWYREAHIFSQYLATTYDTTLEIAAGVISALSPRERWERNKRYAETVLDRRNELESLSAENAAEILRMTMRSNVVMAVLISRGSDIDSTLTGTKRRSFYNNIIAPDSSDSVTVDTWMQRAVMILTGWTLKETNSFVVASRTMTGGTGVGYIAIAEAARLAASRLNVIPLKVQALYWIAVRGKAA
jgi:hypothetical protein